MSRSSVSILILVASFNFAVFAWLNRPVDPPPWKGPVAGVSFSPYREGQSPVEKVFPTEEQIREDLRVLAPHVRSVRTYTSLDGMDQIPRIANEFGLAVTAGAWLDDNRKKNEREVRKLIASVAANENVNRVIVGNEVLLRGDMTATDLADTIRAVKARVDVPVTYADVWEFWLRHRDIAAAVDFVTVHILPYWEDLPVAADRAAAHVAAVRQKVAAAFPGKEVLIGEVGWPSAGRMREGALPSPANQARVIQDVLALAKRENFHVNVIEAYDAPWKRALEGTVGGHWGLIDDARQRKFAWGEAVSNHPWWRWQAAGGIAFAILVFAAAFAARTKDAPPARWLAVSANAIAGGWLIGWTVENLPLESLGAAGWSRSLALAAVAAASPLLLSAATTRGMPLPPLARVLNEWMRGPLVLAAGILTVAIVLLTILIALGLVFDPRYKDLPFAPFSAAVVPYLTHSLALRPMKGERGMAELTAAGLLVASVVYIVPNEGLANWQALWLCAALVAFAVSLARVRAAPS
jgi:glucan 1,3-beta-glucosidase